MSAVRWDLFCRVVDNYGDIGVCWRLARQLVAEHGCGVRLWVDDLTALATLVPDAVRGLPQVVAGVELCHWQEPWAEVEVADVVVEAFACQMPPSYRKRMADCPEPPLWLNLEYLSAEAWVEDCHGLASLQADGLRQLFFFPGFTAATGGVLRERGLEQARTLFQDEAAQSAAFLEHIGVVPLAGARRISLFAYEQASLGGWLDALAAGAQPTQLLVPEGRVLVDVARWLGVSVLAVGQVEVRGALQVQVLRFLSQPEYDRLLWSCDFNVVRGEDSFVRALWAARPLLWHIYRQEQEVHLEKLQAFLGRYAEGLSPSARQALEGFWLAWNREQPLEAAWRSLESQMAELSQHACRWSRKQAGETDLAASLVGFVARRRQELAGR